jgi:hypothetical protein
MTTETTTATGSGQDATAEEKINQLRELFADAPEVGRTALEKVLSRLASDVAAADELGSRCPPLVCVGGQPSAAGWQLLDLLTS